MQAVDLQFSNKLNYGCSQFPGVPLKLQAEGLQFSNNLNYGCPQFPEVPLKIAGQQFSGELLDLGAAIIWVIGKLPA